MSEQWVPRGRLDGKVAVVTGGASGMGLAAVELFVEEGGRVVFTDLAAETAAEMVERLGPEKAAMHHTRQREKGGEHDGDVIATKLGPAATFVPADITDGEAFESVFDRAVESYGGVDVLFNCAGIGGPEGAIVDSPEAYFDRILDVDLKAVWRGIKLAAPLMRSRGGGSIINISACASILGFPGLGSYSAAKAGVAGLARVAAVELAPDLIRVNTISPGPTWTPMLFQNPMMSEAPDPAAVKDQFRKGQPLPVLGEPRDIAAAALFLASDEARWITGQVLAVDGGQSIESSEFALRYSKDHAYSLT